MAAFLDVFAGSLVVVVTATAVFVAEAVGGLLVVVVALAAVLVAEAVRVGVSELVRSVGAVSEVGLRGVGHEVSGVFRAAARAVFPSACRGCGRVADALCDACGANARAAPSRVPPPGIDYWWSPYAYVPPVRLVVADVKYRNRRAAVAGLAAAMVAALHAGGASPDDFDAVTWIPATKRRRRARGFDHAQLYAREVAARIGRPALALLDRADERVQTGRPAHARRSAGPRFTARPPLPDGVGAASPASGLRCRRILLVDDVATTGTTLRNAAAVLRRSGVASVSGLTAARALPRSQGAAP